MENPQSLWATCTSDGPSSPHKFFFLMVKWNSFYYKTLMKGRNNSCSSIKPPLIEIMLRSIKSVTVSSVTMGSVLEAGEKNPDK